MELEKITKIIRIPKMSKTRRRALWGTIFFTVVLIVEIIFLMQYIFDAILADNIIYVEENNNVEYYVYYNESDYFISNEELNDKKDRVFLLGYTDYIIVSNVYSAQFSKEIPVTYDYKATETLIIRYAKSLGSGSDAPIVVEKKFLVGGGSGDAFTNKLVFSGGFENGSPGSAYLIYLSPFQEIYNEFVKDEAARASEQGLKVDQRLNFTAELHVDFTYSLSNAKYGLNKSITRGVTIPLTDQVYAISYTGSQGDSYGVAQREVSSTRLPVNIFITCGLVLTVFGLACGVYGLTKSQDEFMGKLIALLRRYDEDIVIITTDPAEYIASLELSSVRVERLEELLKISVSQSKPITCYFDARQKMATFFISCDEFIYEYILR